MLADYSILLIGAILVNNFVLVQFLGLCPFMGVSNKLETAMGMSMATTFVLTLASACSHLTYNFLLQPLGLANCLLATSASASAATTAAKQSRVPKASLQAVFFLCRCESRGCLARVSFALTLAESTNQLEVSSNAATRVPHRSARRAALATTWIRRSKQFSQHWVRTVF